MGHESAPNLAIVYNLAKSLVVVCKFTSFNLLTCFVKYIQIMQIDIFTYSYVFQKLPFDLSQRFLPIWHVFGVILPFAYNLLIPLVIVGNSTGCHLFTSFLKYMQVMVIHIIRNTYGFQNLSLAFLRQILAFLHDLMPNPSLFLLLAFCA